MANQLCPGIYIAGAFFCPVVNVWKGEKNDAEKGCEGYLTGLILTRL